MPAVSVLILPPPNGFTTPRGIAIWSGSRCLICRSSCGTKSQGRSRIGGIAVGLSAGPPSKPIVRRLEQRAGVQQLGVAAEAADQLQADRQAVAAKAARQ